ncbi:MAG: hypothetical protein IJ751_07665 [Oscillospiraceae bacterium]|nr:hypothetical protein [Oscillospiraceae bacterium]
MTNMTDTTKSTKTTRSPLWWLLPATLLALSLIFLLAAIFTPRNRVTATPVDRPLAIQSPEEEPAHMLVVDEGGRVCVYLNDELMLTTDIPVSSLPQADRDALARGIDVTSQQELTALLEDLGS